MSNTLINFLVLKNRKLFLKIENCDWKPLLNMSFDFHALKNPDFKWANSNLKWIFHSLNEKNVEQRPTNSWLNPVFLNKLDLFNQTPSSLRKQARWQWWFLELDKCTWGWIDNNTATNYSHFWDNYRYKLKF